MTNLPLEPMRYFILENPDSVEQSAVIQGSDARHIKHVLRLKPGDRIGLSDGRGMTFDAAIEAFLPDGVKVRVLSRRISAAESPVYIMVAQSFLKDRKMDVLIRHITELGISKWMPFYAERSVPRHNKRRLASRIERWKKISREALKQCKRGRVIEIEPVPSLQEVFLVGQGCDLKIIFWEDQEAPVDIGHIAQQFSSIQRIITVLGPEGGFSKEEIEAAEAHGFLFASLGPRILRAETATIAAVSLLQYLFGDMGKKS